MQGYPHGYSGKYQVKTESVLHYLVIRGARLRSPRVYVSTNLDPLFS